MEPANVRGLDGGSIAVADARRRTRGCARPIRLTGSTLRRRIDPVTGELGPVLDCYASGQELDGVTWLRCGDRRAYRCESCSREYKGDAWHLLSAGLAGGKAVPELVAAHPAVFMTLTAPSFGPVHGRRSYRTSGGRRPAPCRPRRDSPVCPHGRPLWCPHRHQPGDKLTGEPLCPECYDYEGHVLWQWKAPELWRRFTIAAGRTLARRLGLSERRFRELGRVSYVKVAEFQARGLIHVHAVMRLDGPAGYETAPVLPVDAHELATVIRTAAATAALEVDVGGFTQGPVTLRWGDQVDTRPITHLAGRDHDVQGDDVHPELLAAYLAKYLTKATEEFGLDGRITSAHHARHAGASPHAVRIIETAERLAATGHGDCGRIAIRYGTLGFRGHVITKTRRYSTTFRQLRHARQEWHRHRLDPDEVDVDDPGIVVERQWTYQGRGYFALDTAARALAAAARARTRDPSHLGFEVTAAQ